MKIFLSMLCGVWLVGCTAVTMKEPFPETKLSEEEREALIGAWYLEDEMVYHVAFTSNGVPWMAWMEWADEKFQTRQMRIHFTKHADSLYFCLPVEPGETNEYLFAEFQQDEGKALVWLPDEDACEGLVEKGLLEKDEAAEDLRLRNPAEDVLELIATNSAVFNYKEPIILRKLD